MAVIDWNDKQRASVRQILLTDWEALTEGDISLVFLAMQQRDEVPTFTTIKGSAHAKFWQHLITLEWADPVEMLPGMTELGIVGFRLNDFGFKALPGFIKQYDLMLVGKNARSYGKANGLADYYTERYKEWQAANASFPSIIWFGVKKYPYMLGVIPLFLILKTLKLL